MTKIQRLERKVEAADRVFKDIHKILKGLENGETEEYAYARATGKIQAVLEREDFRQDNRGGVQYGENIAVSGL
jgi:hypothetical protein